ncbi:hypothetical protein QA640_21345 [Bradyrhizobium sp. CB82]|uniref:hypothetical protein n=1 Tax=Bradyrhizobium sp. CB82 TaxID=3039159 RepID=UPI0024B24243|nr:hypothetical protein [Bradyrhizobium sp. CB82]WFU44776.1 hypothetical protein QA640_21345 [Bradyrhizobium sp. CB82]
MMGSDRAMARDADQDSDRANERPGPRSVTGAMALQSCRGYEAAPQSFVRLTGSHLAKPRFGRNLVTE